MPITILPKQESALDKFGSGLGQGLQALATNHLEEIITKKHQTKMAKNLENFFPKDIAHSLANLPPQFQQDAFKALLRPQKAGWLQSLLGGQTNQVPGILRGQQLGSNNEYDYSQNQDQQQINNGYRQPGDLERLAVSHLARVPEVLGIPGDIASLIGIKGLPTSGGIRNEVQSLAENIYGPGTNALKPRNVVEDITQRLASYGPLSFLLGGTPGVISAASSAAAGGLLHAAGAHPLVETAGEILGGFAPTAVRGLKGLSNVSKKTLEQSKKFEGANFNTGHNLASEMHPNPEVLKSKIGPKLIEHFENHPKGYPQDVRGVIDNTLKFAKNNKQLIKDARTYKSISSGANKLRERATALSQQSNKILTDVISKEHINPSIAQKILDPFIKEFDKHWEAFGRPLREIVHGTINLAKDKRTTIGDLITRQKVLSDPEASGQGI